MLITRIGYCEKCRARRMPRAGEPYLYYGGTSQEYYIGIASSKNIHLGYTPHLYEVEAISEDRKTIHYRKLCAMSGCGAFLTSDEEGEIMLVDETKWSEVLSMSIERWNALVLFKDETLKI